MLKLSCLFALNLMSGWILAKTAPYRSFVISKKAKHMWGHTIRDETVTVASYNILVPNRDFAKSGCLKLHLFYWLMVQWVIIGTLFVNSLLKLRSFRLIDSLSVFIGKICNLSIIWHQFYKINEAVVQAD